jgi:hypothetical protein
MTVFERDGRADVLVHEQPLDGIGSEPNRVVITFTADDCWHLAHFVEAPDAVLLELENDRIETALVIVAPTKRTEIRFRSALPLEMVDGVVH